MIKFNKDRHKTRCLKCGRPIELMVSLCDSCLGEEFEKMEYGDPSGYLYANVEYKKYKEAQE